MAINTKAVLSDSAVDLMTQAVIISGNSVNKIDAYVTQKEEEAANSISFTVYSRTSKATTPLTDGTDATSESMADTKFLLDPEEYGKVITTTTSANLATGGKADLAAAELVGINLGETTDTLGLLAIEAGTNTFTATTVDTLSKGDLRRAYTELSAKGIAKFEDGRYVAFLNPEEVADI